MTPYYERGGITIYHGDCRDVLPHLAIDTADLVVTDPPYAVSVSGMVHVGQPGKGSRRLDFFAGDADWSVMTALVLDAVRAWLPALRHPASWYVWCGHREFGALVRLAEDLGYATRFLVWAKECPVPPPPGSGWPSGAELCVYAYPPGRHWRHRADAPRSNVLRADSYRFGQPGKVDHPTQKPLEVITPPDSRVLPAWRDRA